MTEITIVTVEEQHFLAARTSVNFAEIPAKRRTDMYHLLA